MIKKIIVIVLLFLGLAGCQDSQIMLDKEVTVDLFYIETCSECKAFKEKAIPYLENRYGEGIVIHQYDLDDSATASIYDSFIDQISYFDEELYGYGPFIVVEDYFALLGYESGDEKLLANDIEKAVKGEQLGDELEGIRFEFE